jgi:hypothetical protein
MIEDIRDNYERSLKFWQRMTYDPKAQPEEKTMFTFKLHYYETDKYSEFVEYKDFETATEALQYMSLSYPARRFLSLTSIGESGRNRGAKQ